MLPWERRSPLAPDEVLILLVELPGDNIVHELVALIDLDELLLSRTKLSQCPEARVRGSTDTSPSSLQKEGSIKSVSVGIKSRAEPPVCVC